MFHKNYYDAAIIAYKKASKLPELYYNSKNLLFPSIIAFNKASPELNIWTLYLQVS